MGYLARGNSHIDRDKAIADYNKTIELKPDYAFAYNNRGNVYDDKGEYDKAIGDYNKTIELKPILQKPTTTAEFLMATKGIR